MVYQRHSDYVISFSRLPCRSGIYVLLPPVFNSFSFSGWVPVSAKENDRSIDLAFTSFLRYLVEKKLNLEQVENTLYRIGEK
jgi:hypothetical protein